jgi:hypothetical protein
MMPPFTTRDTNVGQSRTTAVRLLHLLQTPPPQIQQPPIDLTNDELLTMRDNVAWLLRELGIPIPIPLPPQPLTPPPPNSQQQCQFDAFDNAKNEQIACQGLKPLYDGSPSNLIPTLNLIHIRRQNLTWYPATFITTSAGMQLNLVQEFSKNNKDVILARAKTIWDNPNIAVVCHTRGTMAYHARLFGVYLTSSMTSKFLTVLYSQLDPEYSMDGPLLLHTICHHIHRNHVTQRSSVVLLYQMWPEPLVGLYPQGFHPLHLK